MWPFIVIGVVVVLLLGGVISMLAYTTPIAEKVYREYLVNPHPENRTRECSCVTNEEQVAMWNAGCEWAEGIESVGVWNPRLDKAWTKRVDEIDAQVIEAIERDVIGYSS